MKRPRVEKNLEQLNRNPLHLELSLPEREWAIHLTLDYFSHCVQQKLSLIILRVVISGSKTRV